MHRRYFDQPSGIFGKKFRKALKIENGSDFNRTRVNFHIMMIRYTKSVIF